MPRSRLTIRSSRQVAINASKRRDAQPLEKLGEYDPIPRPPPPSSSLASAIANSYHLASRAPSAEELAAQRRGEKKIVWDVERVRYWLGVGAQPTESVVKLLERVSSFGVRLCFAFGGGGMIAAESRGGRKSWASVSLVSPCWREIICRAARVLSPKAAMLHSNPDQNRSAEQKLRVAALEAIWERFTHPEVPLHVTTSWISSSDD